MLLCLWKKLYVEVGWEVVFEVVLCECFVVFEVLNFDWVKVFVSDVLFVKFVFYVLFVVGELFVVVVGLWLVLLFVCIDDVGICVVLNDWFGNVYVVDDVV